MTVYSQAQLDTLLPDDAIRDTSTGITASVIRDLLDSLIAVGGTMFARNVPLPITTSWVPLAIATNSIDTKGLQEDLATGEYIVGAGAAGTYKVDVSLGIESGVAGDIEIAVTKNGVLTNYRKPRTLTAGGMGDFGLVASGELAVGDRIGVSIRGSGNTTITATAYQFRAFR